MQLQILLISFSINFCHILTHKAAVENLFKAGKTTNDQSAIDDTPSPEWIKYQQERYQNLDKLSTKYQQPKEPAVPRAEATSRQENVHREEKSQQDDYEIHGSKDSEEFVNNKVTSAVEFPSIQGFIEFIKTLKQTWMKKSLFRLDDKIKMLYQLKDSLLKTIENQFMVLWKDDDDDETVMTATEKAEDKEAHDIKRGRHLRTKRGILGESSINFPPDAALMSINFLTFAVFLIKLVLQVVNIVRTKHYQLSTVTMDAGTMTNG